MKFDETTASQCRYGNVLERVFGDWDIVWEDSEADYQGHEGGGYLTWVDAPQQRKQ